MRRGPRPRFGETAQIGARIAAARARARMTAHEMARALGVHRATVYRIEDGTIACWPHLQRIADILGCDVFDLAIRNRKTT